MENTLTKIFFLFSDKIDDLHSSGDDSETEDEEDIEGHDDREIDDEEEISMMKLSLVEQPATEGDASAAGAGKSEQAEATEERRRVSVTSMETKPQPEQKTAKKSLNKIAKSMDSLIGHSFSNKAQNTEQEASESRDILPKAFSFDTTKRKVSRDNHRKFSTESDPGVRTEFQTQGASRLVRQGAIKTARLGKAKKVDEKEEANPGQKVWAERRWVEIRYSRYNYHFTCHSFTLFSWLFKILFLVIIKLNSD